MVIQILLEHIVALVSCYKNENSLNCRSRLDLLCFLHFKEFELYLGAVFFQDLFTHFEDF